MKNVIALALPVSLFAIVSFSIYPLEIEPSSSNNNETNEANAAAANSPVPVPDPESSSYESAVGLLAPSLNSFATQEAPDVQEQVPSPKDLPADTDANYVLEDSQPAVPDQDLPIAENEPFVIDYFPPAVETLPVAPNVVAAPIIDEHNHYHVVPHQPYYADQYVETTQPPVVHYHQQTQPPVVHYHQQNQSHVVHQTHYQPVDHPALNVDNYGLLHYRRLMVSHAAPHPSELQGTWRGVNKGLATVAIDRYFIKEFSSYGSQVYGDNVAVKQPGLFGNGNPTWQPRTDGSGGLVRQGRFKVQSPRGIGAFRHAAILNYSAGGNRPLDPANLIVDRVVKLDDNHMLGRATVKLGPIPIPLAYFVLQRVQE